MPRPGHLLKLCLTGTHPAPKKPAGPVPGPASQAAQLEPFSVDVTVAISAVRDQIFVCIVAQQASRAHVVNLETIGARRLDTFGT